MAKAIRGGGTRAKADIPIVLLSGNMDRNSLVTARDAGVTEFVAKPVVVAKIARCNLGAAEPVSSTMRIAQTSRLRMWQALTKPNRNYKRSLNSCANLKNLQPWAPAFPKAS